LKTVCKYLFFASSSVQNSTHIFFFYKTILKITPSYLCSKFCFSTIFDRKAEFVFSFLSLPEKDSRQKFVQFFVQGVEDGLFRKYLQSFPSLCFLKRYTFSKLKIASKLLLYTQKNRRALPKITLEITLRSSFVFGFSTKDVVSTIKR
jgi:hypothetical protein